MLKRAFSSKSLRLSPETAGDGSSSETDTLLNKGCGERKRPTRERCRSAPPPTGSSNSSWNVNVSLSKPGCRSISMRSMQVEVVDTGIVMCPSDKKGFYVAFDEMYHFFNDTSLLVENWGFTCKMDRSKLFMCVRIEEVTDGGVAVQQMASTVSAKIHKEMKRRIEKSPNIKRSLAKIVKL